VAGEKKSYTLIAEKKSGGGKRLGLLELGSTGESNRCWKAPGAD